MTHRHDEFDWNPQFRNSTPRHVSATPRNSLFIAVTLIAATSALVFAALAPARVTVTPWSPNLVRTQGAFLVLDAEGDTVGWCELAGPQTETGAARLARNIVRDGVLFRSTRDDIDVTFSQLCPE